MVNKSEVERNRILTRTNLKWLRPQKRDKGGNMFGDANFAIEDYARNDRIWSTRIRTSLLDRSSANFAIMLQQVK